jgi:taurine dioxygenase
MDCRELLLDQIVKTVPLAGRIGAEVREIKLSSGLEPSIASALRHALLYHKVLFFRGQDHLDESEQEDLAILFGGNPVPHPTFPVLLGSRYTLELDSRHGDRSNAWHTPVSFVAAFPSISILRAVELPEVGGDTIWANTAAAYRDLSPDLQNLADRLWALHTNDLDFAASHPDANEETLRRYRDIFASTIYESEHPVVQVHPESGERSLLLGHFVKRILGTNPSESARLIQIFQEAITRPENTVRWCWQPGDVAIWDNRSIQLYAIHDYGDQARVFRRVTVEGRNPISVDGRRSSVRSLTVRTSDAKSQRADI